MGFVSKAEVVAGDFKGRLEIGDREVGGCEFGDLWGGLAGCRSVGLGRRGCGQRQRGGKGNKKFIYLFIFK